MYSATFAEQLRRLHAVTGTRTQAELADVLGIRQSSVSDARRRGRIPAEWLLTLLRSRGVHPDWVLAGTEPQFLALPPKPAPQQEAQEQRPGEMPRQSPEAALLRRLPFRLLARMLAEELLRRDEPYV